MKKFKMEENIPIPNRTNGKESIYPFIKMKIGNSFSIRLAKGDNSKSVYSSLHQASKTFSKNNPDFAFTIRRDEKVVRIWRIAKT